MKAVAIYEFGGPEVLTVADIDVPEPGSGEVRVRVAAATVNPTDIGMRTAASAATLEALPKPYVPGMELAGTVDALGPDTTGFAVGDPVLGIVVPGRHRAGSAPRIPRRCPPHLRRRTLSSKAWKRPRSCR